SGDRPSDAALFRSCLAGLLLEHFAGVAHALLLVGIGLAQPADVRRDLTDELSIHAGDGDVRLLLDRDVDPGRDLEHDRMRVPEREHHLLPLHLRAVPDADDVELLLVAFGHAEHGVGDEAASQPVKLAQLRVFGPRLGDQMAVGDLEADAGRNRLAHLPLRALHVDGAVGHLDGDALRHGDWFLPDSRHINKPVASKSSRQTHQMLHNTSPPTPAFAAARPVMTPRDVVRMLVPSPPSTSGTSSRPKYTRRPGRLMRSTPVIRRSPCGPYF